jgi:glycosyltransferase involved in cell wall biosynthesis
MSEHGYKSRVDVGFGRALAWDIDLLSGYDYEFISAFESSYQHTPGWLVLNRGFARRLKATGAKTLWVQGWQVIAYAQAVWLAHRMGVETWMRAETNLASSGNGSKTFFGKVKTMVRTQILRNIDQFLFIGNGNRQFYLAEGVKPELLHFAPYGVDNRHFAATADAFREGRRDLRAKWKIPENAFTILFVGKFEAKKRPLDLIAAVSALQEQRPDRKIHILWVGSGELGPILRQNSSVSFDGDGAAYSCDARDKRPSASFAGFLNQSEIAQAYVAADCLVLPSGATETWGLVVNEAMACGLPCVVSDACGCAADLVTPLRADLCFPVGNTQRLQESLEALMFDRPSPDQLRRHIQRYDCLRTVELVEKLYSSAHPSIMKPGDSVA